MSENKRIVITGLGVVSSIGIGEDLFWQSLIAGKSGISEVSAFDTADFSTHKGGEVKDFLPQAFINKRSLKRLGRASRLAIAAARLALDSSQVKITAKNKHAGICLGTTMGESQVLEVLNAAWVNQGVEAIEAGLIPMYPSNVLSVNVAITLGLEGPNYVIPTACAAGNYAVGYAYDLIKMGEAEMMLAGGADAFSKIAFIGFNRMFAVAPEKCQPFDKDRKGMMVGEGAAVVVLESLESALARKAKIYAEILGYGLSCDAHHMTAPSSEGISRAIAKSLEAGNVTPEEVDYFNAHGTGTLANDKEECLAIKNIFGDNCKRLAVSSIKSMLGHTMGAASAIETVACCLAIKNDIIPPTINYQTPDPECDIDCVPNVARQQKVTVALNSASAFGGNNACLVLKRYFPVKSAI